MKRRQKLSGSPAFPGVSYGKACVLGEISEVPRRRIRPGDVGAELERFQRALDRSRRQLEQLKAKVRRQIGPGEAAIFQAHLLFLSDPYFFTEVEKKLVSRRMNLEWAIKVVMEEAVKTFSAVDDVYLRERAQDIRDVGSRILGNLVGEQRQCLLTEEQERVIVIAEEMTPSVTFQVEGDKIGGFAAERGGATSHGVILARSLGVPFVVGVRNLISKIELGDPVLVDGFTGDVIVSPNRADILKGRRAQLRIERERAREAALATQPAVTRDGTEISLLANVANAEEARRVRELGAQGIGLFRTEYLFLKSEGFPPEEDQVRVYSEAVRSVAPHPVIIRTLDLGGDRYLPQLGARDPNPDLGWRGIRISLDHPEHLKIQFRAILRAGAVGAVKTMFPLVSSLEDVRRLKAILSQARHELRRQGIPHRHRIDVGAMIEVPSAAIAASFLVREVDFLSVGTNDLIQYTLAVDRNNAKVQSFYEPLNPAVIWLLQHLVKVSRAAGKPLYICGEMAGDRYFTPLLLGLGYRELSMNPALISSVKEVVRSVSIPATTRQVRRLLKQGEVRIIRKSLDQWLRALTGSRARGESPALVSSPQNRALPLTDGR
jgi:phosphotransferase system enzyme I (PtsI)